MRFKLFLCAVLFGLMLPGVAMADGINRIAIEAAGLNIGNTGSIRGGQTAYNTGTGFFLGFDGAYKFSIGHDDGNRVTWDGTNLGVLAGNLTINKDGVRLPTTTEVYLDAPNAYGFTGTYAGIQYKSAEASKILKFFSEAQFAFYQYAGDTITADWQFFTDGGVPVFTSVGGGSAGKLGTATVPFSALFLDPATEAAANPILVLGYSGEVHAVNDGCSGTPTDATNGIVTGCTTPANGPAVMITRLQTELAGLTARLAMLESELARVRLAVSGGVVSDKR